MFVIKIVIIILLILRVIKAAILAIELSDLYVHTA